MDRRQDLNGSGQSIRQFRRRLGLSLLLWRFLGFATFWLLCWGLVVLACRVGLGRLSYVVPVCALGGLAAVVAVAWWRVRRRLPTVAEAAAYLDNFHACGGLLVAGQEVDGSAWQQLLAERDKPVPRWQLHDRRLYWSFVAANLFLLAAWLVPERYIQTPTRHQLDLTALGEKLAAQIELVEELAVVTEEAAVEMRTDLERIQAASHGDDPVRTWEALDHVAEKLQNLAAAAAEADMQAAEKLAAAQILAAGLSELGAEPGHTAAFTAATEELAKLLAQISKDNQLLAQRLAGSDAMNAGTQELTAEQLRQLSELLSNCSSDLQARLAELAKCGLIEGGLAEACSRLSAEDLAAMLAECKENGASGLEALLTGLQGMPGRGGVSRGRADAAMTWSAGTSEEDAAFTPEVLPLTALGGLENSVLTGLTATAPEIAAPSTAGGAISGLAAAVSDGGTTVKQTVLPRHRQAVRNYFTRE